MSITDSGPRCISNTSLTDLLCTNDCNLDPDKFELNCSVVYHGNIPPVLEWRHSESSKFISFKTTIEAQSTSNHTVTIKSSTLSPSLELNGTHYICSLENVRTKRINTGCVTENIRVTCESVIQTFCENRMITIIITVFRSACLGVISYAIMVIMVTQSLFSCP